jgi:hypothetical protein
MTRQVMEVILSGEILRAVDGDLLALNNNQS